MRVEKLRQEEELELVVVLVMVVEEVEEEGGRGGGVLILLSLPRRRHQGRTSERGGEGDHRVVSERVSAECVTVAVSDLLP